MNSVTSSSASCTEEKEPHWISGGNRKFSVRSPQGCDSPSGDFTYEMTRRIKEGACGAVYVAVAKGSHSPRVVKKDLSQSSDMCSSECRFFRSLLGQPHVLQIRGGDLKSKLLAFDYIPAEDLEEAAKKAPLPTTSIILCWKQALEALVACRKKSMVHRDLKPANGILEPSGLFTLIDGGLAASLAPGQTLRATDGIGTPAYQAPEFWLGLRYDHSVDLWSLGAMIFELYTGQPLFAFKEDTSTNYALQQLQETLGPIPPDLYDKSAPLQFAATTDGAAITFNTPVTASLDKVSWQSRIKEAAAKRKDSEQFAERLIEQLSGILRFKDRISLEKALASPLFTYIFDFHIQSPTDLPGEYLLELSAGKRISSFPLCRRINETCLHLFDQKKGAKGGVFNYRLVRRMKGKEELLDKGTIELTSNATVRIDLTASTKVTAT